MTSIESIVNWIRGRADAAENTNLKGKPAFPIAMFAAFFLLTQVAFAQVRGGAVTLHYATLSPIIALLAGILILIMPRLLNFIVAIYLIIVGLIGLFGV